MDDRGHPEAIGRCPRRGGYFMNGIWESVRDHETAQSGTPLSACFYANSILGGVTNSWAYRPNPLFGMPGLTSGRLQGHLSASSLELS